MRKLSLFFHKKIKVLIRQQISVEQRLEAIPFKHNAAMKLSYLLPVFTICLFPYFSQSQKYSLKEADDVWDDYLHEQFYIPTSGQYLLVNYASPHGGFNYNRNTDITTVVSYDSKMKKKYTVEVKELAGKKYQTSLSTASSLFMFYRDKDGTVYKSQLDPKDGSASLGEKVFSFSGERSKFIKGVSPDSSHYFILVENSTGKSGNEDYTGVVMDKQMNVIRKFSTSSNEERKNIMNRDELVTNDGTLLIINSVKTSAEKGSFHPVEQQIKRIGTDGNTTTSVLSGLPDGLFDNIMWTIEENNLAFVGLLAKTKKSDYTSVISGKFDLTQKKVNNIKETELNQVSYIQNSTHSLVKDILKEGIPTDVELIHDYLNSDHSKYLILEQNNSRTTSMGQYYAAGGAAGPMSQFGGTNYFNNNVYVIKLSAKGEVMWLKVVAKKQIQSETEVCSSIAVLKDSKNGLHLLYNDDTKNTDAEPNKKVSTATLDPKMKNTSLACSYITNEGTMTKTLLQNNEDVEHFFSPENFVAANANKILYTSYRVRNMGKSTFRLGVLDLK